MAEYGWISLYRKIRENPIYNDKPYDRTHAWVDLLMRVNHEDKKITLGNEIILVSRGSTITSISKLCEAWGWSNTKIKNFLNLLQNDNMITFFSTTKNTTINVVNYSVYQDGNDTESITKTHQKHNKSITKAQQKHTNNNDNNSNNENNDNNDNKSIGVLSQTIEDFKEMRKKNKKPMTDHAVELMLKKLEALSEGNEITKIKILEESILNGWLGIFPLKQESKNSKQFQSSKTTTDEEWEELYKYAEQKDRGE
jgi:hypothetical protein